MKKYVRLIGSPLVAAFALWVSLRKILFLWTILGSVNVSQWGGHPGRDPLGIIYTSRPENALFCEVIAVEGALILFLVLCKGGGICWSKAFSLLLAGVILGSVAAQLTDLAMLSMVFNGDTTARGALSPLSLSWGLVVSGGLIIAFLTLELLDHYGLLTGAKGSRPRSET